MRGVAGTLGAALEAIRAEVAILALLLAEGLEDVLNGLQPQLAKHRCVAGGEPVLVGQSQRVAERVNLIFALVQEWLHLCEVFHPLATRIGLKVECVGVGIEADAVELT